MSKIKQETGTSNKKHQPVLRGADLPASFPALSTLHEIILLDHNDKPYVFRLIPEVPSEPSEDDAILEHLSVDLNDIKEGFIFLTEDQRKIAMHIYYMYINKIKITTTDDSGETHEHNPRIILQGPAGTGKSTVINFIEKLITWEENKTSDSPQNIKVLKCAFTGIAASNIDGRTLHNTFAIHPMRAVANLSKKNLSAKKSLLKDCILFICDEISMVGTNIMRAVNRRLQQIFNNNELYGDRFVLLVGDLYQIDPVSQKPVYPDSIYWKCCEFYELTKIIRQDEQNLINALNNFRDSRMTDDDIELLRSRRVQARDVPNTVVHLYFLNEYVERYNKKRIDESTEEEKIVNCINSDDWEPANLRIKRGIRYMITYNVDVADGLANGATGVVKEFDCNGEEVVTIWMEFKSDTVGRTNKAEYFAKHGNRPGYEKWVPIQRSKVVVKLKSNPKVSRPVGNMFPLRAAEAVTVHKSQGQTYHEGVCVNITDNRYDRLRSDKSLLYVALSRVKRLEHLYIVGSLNLTSMSTKKFVKTENELNRLRNEVKLKLAYETFEDKKGDVIIYLNTGSTFDKHHQFVSSDEWFRHAALLIFTETNTIVTDTIDIPNFVLAFRSDNNTVFRSGRGIICYRKTENTLEMIHSISDDKRNINLTLLLYDKYLYIITGVKGNLSADEFKLAISLFVSNYIQDSKCIVLIGDIDASSTSLHNLFNEFKEQLRCEVSTVDNKTLCDMVFTRHLDIQQNQIGFYAYIPSRHKPMFVELPRAAEPATRSDPGPSQHTLRGDIEKMELS